jgi:fatty-acyl-CoA synthase
MFQGASLTETHPLGAGPVHGDWLAVRARKTPNRIALTDAATGENVTYRAWNARVNQTARWLRGLGIAKGDRVAVLARGRLGVLDLFFACGKLGAIAQMLNVRLTASELATLLGRAPPRLLVFDEELASAPRLGSHADKLVSTDAMMARDRESPEWLESTRVSADDPWVICYTGGSTGTSKGAVLTYGNIHANAFGTVASWGLSADDVAVLNAPLFHVGGLFVLTTPLVFAGGRSIVCDRFDAGQVLSLVECDGVTVLFGVPTMHLALCCHSRFATTDLSRLKLVVSGGAPCPATVADRMFARGVPFRQGYGLTEAGPNNFWISNDEARNKRTSVGYPLVGVEAMIVDERGHRVAAGVPGELALRGAHVFAGYWGDEAETTRAFQDGWLRTGDLAIIDEDGAYAIVGRLKDVIISGGEKIYPSEIESVLSLHPDVMEVCVIGVSDSRLGEVVRAVVVSRSAASQVRADLLAFARSRLARFKVPRDVVHTHALPRTPTGKLDRRSIADAFGTRKTVT